MHPTTSDAIWATRTSSKAKETDLLIGSFGDPKPFTGTVDYDEAQPDFEVEYVHAEYTNGFIVERKLLDDMQYENIFDRAENLATSFARWREKTRWSVLVNAFTAGATAGYDAKALCADDHPRSQSDATAVDNALALPLSSDNLDAAIIAMMAFPDDRGEEISLMPNLLIVPRALRKTAFELTQSEWTPEDANTAANIHRGMQYLVVPWLTDTSAWFVVDTVMSKRWLKWYDRIPMEFAGVDDFDTLVRKYRGYVRRGFGWSNFRWIIGSTG
jgi:hypothetical protein